MTSLALGAGLAALAVLLWPRSRIPMRHNDVRTTATSSRKEPQAVGHLARRRPDLTSTDEVASCMVLLSVALQSGCGVVEGMEQAARVAMVPCARDLAVVAAALRWGVGDDLAWSAVDPLWSRAAAALRLAVASGVAPSHLLLAATDDLRSAQVAAIEVAGARVGVRMVLPLGLTFLPAFVLTTVVPLVLALAGQVLA